MYTNSKGIGQVAHSLILPCGFLIVTNAINCTIQVPAHLYLSISIYFYLSLFRCPPISIYLHLYLSLTIYRSLSIQTLYLSLPLSIAIYL